MIDYLERALRQNQAKEEEEQEAGNCLLSETEGRFLLSQRTEKPSPLSLRSGIPGPPEAARPIAAPAPGALTRSLRQTEELPSIERGVPALPPARLSVLHETEGQFSLPAGAKEPSLLSQPSGAVLRVPSRELPALSLLTSLRRSDDAADFARHQSRTFTVTLPEAPDPAPGLTAGELDRAVERDARRYDGGFSLY